MLGNQLSDPVFYLNRAETTIRNTRYNTHKEENINYKINNLIKTHDNLIKSDPVLDKEPDLDIRNKDIDKNDDLTNETDENSKSMNQKSLDVLNLKSIPYIFLLSLIKCNRND